MNMHENAKLTPSGREEFVRRVLEEGHPMRVVGRDMGVSRRTVWKWVNRFRKQGRAGLADRPIRRHASPRLMSPELVRHIQRLRRRRWTGQEIASALELAVSTVGLWLRRLGLGRLRDLEPKPEIVRHVLRHLKRWGIRAPVLAIGDGAIVFWNGLVTCGPRPASSAIGSTASLACSTS